MNISYSQYIVQQNYLDANNIKAYYQNTGVFDNNLAYTNSPGFEWPKNSGKYSNYTAGLSIAAYVNGSIRNASVTYGGEYMYGCVINNSYYSDSTFRIYKVSSGDNAYNNPDWMNWGFMVPYGAPYFDYNNNGLYEPLIDTPVVRNSAQTLFMCITDANPISHSTGFGYGGGTLPLFSEMHITAWCYTDSALADVHFVKFEIINKGINTWNNVMLGFFSDPDLGGAGDDYSGCDTTLNMAYCYNGDNYDEVYGNNPPAFGLMFLRSGYNRSVTPNKFLGMTSYITTYQGGAPNCIHNSGNYIQLYRLLSGLKKDSSSNWDPTYTPYRKTKFCFSGDPETNAGWTNFKGYLYGCGDTNLNLYNNSNDVKFFMNSGADNFNVVPGEKQNIVIAQLIARGSSNLNSVTKLKQLAINSQSFYDLNFPVINEIKPEIIPENYSLGQNYPNPFNSITTIKYQVQSSKFVRLVVFDLLGKEVKTLVSEVKPAGSYEIRFDAAGLSSGVYFYKMTAGDFSDVKKFVLLK